MIKNATILKVTHPAGMPSLGQLDDALSAAQFVHTGPTQEKSLGWVAPRGHDYSPIVESINNARVFRLKVETRKVPAATIAEGLDAMCKHIEQTTGRKHGKKEKRDMKEELLLQLLPKAFPKHLTVTCILDGDMLIMDTASASLADDVATLLIKCVDGIVLDSLNTATSPTTAMGMWLAEQEAPDGFAIGRSCELRACDESSAKVRYTNHPLLTDEVLAHLAQGKQPTSLALEFDDRVGFTLTDSLQLKKIDFGDSVMEQVRSNDINPGDFDGSMAIVIGEMRPLIAELVSALGGFAERPEQTQIQPAQTPPSEHFGDEDDPMYEQACAIVTGPDGRASISYVHRKLLIGYNRAARLLEAMEKAGIVSRMSASGQRDVLNKSKPA